MCNIQQCPAHCFLTNCKPFWSEYRSMNLMNLSHSLGVRITCLATMPSGFPLTNLAFTSVDWITPSSSIMYSPVISPTSPLESKTDGWSKLKSAIPLDPSLDRVSLTSGMVISSVPWMNWSVGFTIIVIGTRFRGFVGVWDGRWTGGMEMGEPVKEERVMG